MTRIAIAGGNGRMGRAFIGATLAARDATLAGTTVRPGSSLVGVDAAELVGRASVGATVVDNVSGIDTAEVLIDFTTIAATLAHLRWCVEAKIPCVIGTTGFSEAEERLIAEASQQIPIVYAPNFSVGVTNALTNAGTTLLHAPFLVDVLHHQIPEDEVVEWITPLLSQLSHNSDQ